jgi:hypothetical protein
MPATPQQVPPSGWRRTEGPTPHVVETFGMDLVLTIGANGDATVYANKISGKLAGLALRSIADDIDPPGEPRNARDELWAVLVEMVDLARPSHTVTDVEMVKACVHLRAALDTL